MIVEYDIPPLWTWLFGADAQGGTGVGTSPALASFGLTVLILLVLALLVSSVMAVARHGVAKGMRIVWSTLRQGVIDFVYISPRRVIGLSGLAVREAIRRQVWVVLVIYVLVLMFAGLMLSSDSPEPAKLYLSFVLQATTYLLLLVALFLAALSLPTDIKNHTIYTIVTKPVMASEILLGRLIGFTIVGTLLLLVMAVASYVFVSRMVSHEHLLPADSMVPVRESGVVVAFQGKTSRANGHQHEVRLEADAFRPGVAVRTAPDGTAAIVTHTTSKARVSGIQVGDRIVAIDDEPINASVGKTPAERIRGSAGTMVRLTFEKRDGVGPKGGGSRTVEISRTRASTYTNQVQGHVHLVTARAEDGKVTYVVGPPEGDLVARLPVYGSLRFLDQDGRTKDRGISVGDVYKYRSYIFGGKMEAAIWTFNDVRAEDYPSGMSLDLSVGVYRSHKGDVTKGVRGSFVVRNPKTERQSQEIIFTSQESKLDRIELPRQMIDTRGEPLDLFNDLVVDGQVEVWIRCVDRGQFFGMAPADLYIRAPDASYTVNFAKRYVQVWLQMLLVTVIALFCSTFLSGPIAIILTFFAIVIGHSTSRLYNLTQCVLFRDEMTIFDIMRRRRIKLDENGYEWFQTYVDKGHTPYTYTSQERLQQAHDLGIDKIESLDRVYGGGPIEAAYRIFTQDNLMSELPREGALGLMRNVDTCLMHVVQALINVFPDFERFGTDDYLANGYNIDASLISQQGCATLAFVVAAMVAGYFMLKTREVAR